MSFVFCRFLVIINTVVLSSAFGVSFMLADDHQPANALNPSQATSTDLAELASIVIPAVEPLDLTDLLRSLGETPSLSNAPQEISTSPVTSTFETSKVVKLVGVDEPIVIGSSQAKEKIEPTTTKPSTKPSNPLRTSSEQPTEDSQADATKSVETPTVAKKESEPLTLSLDEKKVAIDSSELKDAEATDTATDSSVKPKPKMVQIKPINVEEQESPRLSDLPREIDARQAREDDEKAIIAKRPEAAAKTFVGKPSTSQKSSPSNPSSNPVDIRRAQRVESCLSYYLANPESVVERSPWAVMHAMLPFGVEGEIMVGNRRVNAIQWMCYNGTCRTQKLFTPAGKFFRPNVGGGVQGHEGQFLAMLAQSQVSADYPIVVDQNKYAVTDLIRYEMATCKEKSELTFKLIGLSYYLDTEQIWLTDKRSRWSIEKLVQEELAQPIIGAACGGTHRLMGLTFAVRQRKAEGRPVDGQFARADRFVKDFVNYAWKLQNPDGSFSTNWFESRGNEPNMERKVQMTGHILEWLAFTLPDEELTSARFTKSIDFLLSQIWDKRQNKWPIGPRGHATRAIALYHQRTTGISPGQRQSQMAEQIQSLRIVR